MKDISKTIVGSILIIVMPKKAKQLSNKGMTIVVGLTLKERLMRHALLGKAKRNENSALVFLFSPTSIAPMILEPARLVPGIKANI